MSFQEFSKNSCLYFSWFYVVNPKTLDGHLCPNLMLKEDKIMWNKIKANLFEMMAGYGEYLRRINGSRI